MPFDQKKINGPETSFSYKTFLESKQEVSTATRKDSRKQDEHRKFAFQFNAVSKAKGSCYWETGNTKILCAVFELREIPRANKYADKGHLYCDLRYAPFARENRKSIEENEEKLIASNIKTALESTVCLHEFPNYQIDIFILVLEDDGAVLSSSIHAAAMALIDASIPCFDILTSTSASIVNNQFLIDPTREEEEQAESQENKDQCKHGIITITSLCSMDQVTQILLRGFLDPSEIERGQKQLLQMNKDHVAYMKKAITLKLNHHLREH